MVVEFQSVEAFVELHAERIVGVERPCDSNQDVSEVGEDALGAVEAQYRAVQAEVWKRLDGRRVIRERVAADPDDLGPCVGHVHLHALREAALQHRLQRVVLVRPGVGEQFGVGGPAELHEVGLARLAQAGDLSRVQI